MDGQCGKWEGIREDPEGCWELRFPGEPQNHCGKELRARRRREGRGVLCPVLEENELCKVWGLLDVVVASV